MRFCVVQVQPLGCIFVRSSGKFRSEHMKSLIQAIANLDAYGSSQILHDMRLVDFDVPVEQVIEVGRTYPAKPRQGCLAVVSDSVLGFGMLRVIVSIRENESRTVQAFREIGEAINWLDVPGLRDRPPAEVEAILTEFIGTGSGDTDGFNIVMKNVSSGAVASVL